MMLDRNADRALYKQLADLIRAQIERGDLTPGQRIPAESEYSQEFDISRDSVRRALALLRGEGLIITDHRGSYVRPHADQTIVRVDHGRISVRMPAEPERRELGISEGVPILVIERAGHPTEIHPGDRTTIRVGTS